MNSNGFALMEVLMSLLLLGVIGSVILPMYVLVYEERAAIAEKQALLLELEEAVHSHYTNQRSPAGVEGVYKREQEGLTAYCGTWERRGGASHEICFYASSR
ncbi:type II secretion system protein [Shouchella shacheensis]|uniref:type II secretion system protein n=1 Tax=Shouchella shacheensis TaxID=1649580 RepID=UPI00074006A9|nr:type II secretion system protein [Shouchella shacheensis]